MAETTPTPISGRTSKWGEGPIWWDGALYYVDIEDHKLIRLCPDSGSEKVWHVGERIGTVVPTLSADFIYAGDSGFVRFDPDTGAGENIADPEPDLRELNRFNDGKCDAAGRFWAGSISLVKETGSANLYCLETNGRLFLKVPGLTNSNGICWSLDNSILYHIDTPTRSVSAFDFNLRDGHIANRRTVIDTEAAGHDSSPDGMTIDAEGMLWIAFCHGGCVGRFDPATGKQLHQIDLPCVETTACAFGGPGLDRLFVTTGIHTNKVEPDAGRVFVIDGLGVRGVPSNPYRG